MVNQILSFEEILEREEYVLVDTSIEECRRSGSGWFRDFFYPAKTFSDFDEEVLRGRVNDLDFFVSLLRSSKVYTSPGVVFEIENGRNLIQKKIKYLEERKIKHDYFSKELSNRGTSKKRLKRRSHSPNEREVPQEKILREIQD